MSRLHDALRQLEAMTPPEGRHSGITEILRDLPEALNGHAARQVRRVNIRIGPESHIVVNAARNDRVREQFRFIEHRLRKMGESSRIKRVLVTSSTPKEGKTVVAANLAVALASSSSRVLLLDADMRGPATQDLYGINATSGLADILERRATVSDVLLYLEEMKVHYIPAGKPSTSPSDLLNSIRLTALLSELDDFDWIVVDSPPVSTFADALSLASQTDTVIVVARSGMTYKRDLEESLAALKESKIAGVILNAHDRGKKRDGYYSYYSHEKK